MYASYFPNMYDKNAVKYSKEKSLSLLALSLQAVSRVVFQVLSLADGQSDLGQSDNHDDIFLNHDSGDTPAENGTDNNAMSSLRLSVWVPNENLYFNPHAAVGYFGQYIMMQKQQLKTD